MKLSRVILIVPILIGMIGAILPLNSKAQVNNVTLTSTPADTLTWDKKILPTQWAMPKAKTFRTWEAGIHFGVGFPTTDIASSDINASYAKENFLVGFKIAKFFSHSIGAQFEYIYGHLQGQNRKVDTYGYTTTIKYDATINLIAHIGNIRFLSRTPRIGLYASAGVGLIHFDPVNTHFDTVLSYNLHVSNYNVPPDPANYHNTTEYVVPFGIGIRYLLSDKVSLNAEYSLRTTRSDKLDGWWRVLSEDDNYTYANLGITYHFGKQREIIEWVNPVEAIYDHFNKLFNEMKLQVDSFKVDADGDRVSDYWDRDPATPAGYKVYGDGTAVDFDGDGVPDAIDFCPTIPGPASNHGCPVTVVEKVETKKQTEVAKTPITNEEQEIITQVFKNLQFETGKSVIRESSYISLNELANLLKRKTSYKILIEGHTDNVGGAASNMKLSTDRANSVKKYLVDKGIDESRLIAKAYGLTRPVADNKTPEGRQMNRRVDFTIVQ